MADIGLDIEGDADMKDAADKKRKTPEGAAPAAGSAGVPGAMEARLLKVEESLSKMNVTVGQGDYETKENVAVMRGLVVLERDVASMKHAVEDSYELTYPNPIADSMKEEKANWVQECIKAKGQGIQVGDCYHYAFLGLVKAIVQDATLDAEKRKELWRILLTKCGNKEAPTKVDRKRLPETYELCKTCSSKIVKEKCYLNWTPGRWLTATVEGQKVREFIEEAILKHGTIQMNAQPAAPSFKAMKDSLIKRKEWGKGRGKGE